MRSSLARLFICLWLAASSTACAYKPDPVSTIVVPALLRPTSGATDEQTALRSQVNAYIKYLDSLRVTNTKLSQSEQRKFDWMTVFALGLGTTAAIYSFTSHDDDNKAKVSGVTGAVAAFTTALIAKFRHSEDAQQDRWCAKELERILTGFQYPDTLPVFVVQRDSILVRLAAADCLAPQTR